MRKVWPGTARMPIERSPELDSLIELDDTRFVINGHLHYRVIVNFEQLTLLNAGTLEGRTSSRRVDPRLRCADRQRVRVRRETSRCMRVAERPMRDETRRIWRDTQEFDSGWTPVTLYAA